MLPISSKNYCSGLYVFCTQCKSKLHGKTKYKVKSDCKHPNDKQVYKIIVTVPGTKEVKTKFIYKPEGGDYVYDTVLDEARRFYHAVKTQKQYSPLFNTNVDFKPELLVDCMSMYIDYVHDTNIAERKKKNRSKIYLSNIAGSLQIFTDWLKDNNYNLNKLSVKNVNERIVDNFCDFLETLYPNEVTYNNKFKDLRIFYNYLINKKNYIIKNPFDTDNYKSENVISKSITKAEFKRILEVITPENGFYINPVTKIRRNYYRDWLVNAFKFALLTGKRREELVKIKFTDIILRPEDNKPFILLFEDFKHNRLKNIENRPNRKFLPTPFHKELIEFFTENGLDTSVHQDMYIISNDETMDRTTLMEFISKAFTHFAKIAGYDYQFKCLRKTFSTRTGFIDKPIALDLNWHSNNKILNKNYIDFVAVAAAFYNRDFDLLPKE